MLIRILTTEGIRDVETTDPQEIALAFGHATTVKQHLAREARPCPVCKRSIEPEHSDALLAATNPSALIRVHTHCVKQAIAHKPRYKRVDAANG